MEFDKSKVFTPFNCDEVKSGSMGYFSDSKEKLTTVWRTRPMTDKVKKTWLEEFLNCHGADVQAYIELGVEEVCKEILKVTKGKKFVGRDGRALCFSRFELEEIIKDLGVEV